MNNSSSNAVETAGKSNKLIQNALAIVIIVILSIALFSLFSGQLFQSPFEKETLSLQGHLYKGSQLFKTNCAACHGIAAQGHLGPNLHDVTSKLRDTQIINQIIKGKTPPMPSFDIEPQEMADILAYLHSVYVKAWRPAIKKRISFG